MWWRARCTGRQLSRCAAIYWHACRPTNPRNLIAPYSGLIAICAPRSSRQNPRSITLRITMLIIRLFWLGCHVWIPRSYATSWGWHGALCARKSRRAQLLPMQNTLVGDRRVLGRKGRYLEGREATVRDGSWRYVAMTAIPALRANHFPSSTPLQSLTTNRLQARLMYSHRVL